MRRVTPSLGHVSVWLCTILVRHCLGIMNATETPQLRTRPEIFNHLSIADYDDQSFNYTKASGTSSNDLDQFFSFEAFNEDLNGDSNLLLAENPGSSVSQPRAPRILDNTTSEIDVRGLRRIPAGQDASKPGKTLFGPPVLGMIQLLSFPYEMTFL